MLPLNTIPSDARRTHIGRALPNIPHSRGFLCVMERERIELSIPCVQNKCLPIWPPPQNKTAYEILSSHRRCFICYQILLEFSTSPMNIRILRRMIMFRLDISSNLRIPCKAGIRAHGNKPSHGADIGYAVILPNALHDHLPFQIIFS